MDKRQRAEMYVKYLTDQGYKPEIDQDGDVRFKKEGATYYIIIDESDESFFRIVYPNFWKIENEDERRLVLLACDYANRQSKVVKLFTIKENTWANIELFVANAGDFSAVFERAMSALRNGVNNFVQKMRECQKAGEVPSATGQPS